MARLPLRTEFAALRYPPGNEFPVIDVPQLPHALQYFGY